MSLQKEQKQFSEETYSCTELLTTIGNERKKGRVAKKKKPENEEKCGNGKAKSVVYLVCSRENMDLLSCYIL